MNYQPMVKENAGEYIYDMQIMIHTWKLQKISIKEAMKVENLPN